MVVFQSCLFLQCCLQWRWKVACKILAPNSNLLMNKLHFCIGSHIYLAYCIFDGHLKLTFLTVPAGCELHGRWREPEMKPA